MTETITQQTTITQVNKPWGDKITIKPKDTFRIYFQNIHGIQIHQPERWENIIKTSMEEYQSDLVGLCETGLNWKLPYIRNKLQFYSRQHIKINTNIILTQ